MDWQYFVVILILFHVGRYAYYNYIDKKNEKDAFELRENARKNTITQLYKNHEERIMFERFNEEDFWSLIERVGKRNNYSYKNQLGLIKDEVSKMNPEEIIMFDNLLNDLTEKAYNYNVLAAVAIIFKDTSPRSVEIFICWLILKGEVFFKNAILNSDLVVGKDFKDVSDLTFKDIIEDIYFIKKQHFIPFIKDYELKILGDKWEQKDLPIRYPKLWSAYA